MLLDKRGRRLLWATLGLALVGATVTPTLATSGSGGESADVYVIPAGFRVGDLLFCEVADHDLVPCSWDHVAIYVGRDPVTHRMRFVESVSSEGVREVDYSEYHDWATDIVFGTVASATDAEAQAAADFAIGQIGKPYQDWPVPADPDPDSDAWYCSELVWAAYLSVGIDIDGDSWDLPEFVGPCDIASDDDVSMYCGELPLRPKRPEGCVLMRVGEIGTYTTHTHDPQCDWIKYQWRCQPDDSGGAWSLVWRCSGWTDTMIKVFTHAGDYYLQVRAKDDNGASPWSPSLHVVVDPIFTGAPLASEPVAAAPAHVASAPCELSVPSTEPQFESNDW